MYWNHPLIQLTWPTHIDPLADLRQAGQHCLFWNPRYDFKSVKSQYNLTDFCNQLNSMLAAWGVSAVDQDNDTLPGNHYAFTNMVKFNIWTDNLRRYGNIKPWLILDEGDGTYLAGTGDSRLKCLEMVPEITHVQAFISTHQLRAHLYSDLEPVTTLAQFATLCAASEFDQFMFRIADKAAPYGLYWYEHQTNRTAAMTPSDDEALKLLRNYLKQHPDTRATTDWFNTVIDWQSYSE